MKALVLHPPSRNVSLCELPRPEPNAGEVLVRVHAVALNPIDALYAFKPIATQEQRVIGTDFAGVVVEASTEIADTSDARTRPGARVAGFLQGAKPAQATIVPALSQKAASAVSMCGLTAAQGVFARLDLPCPFASTSGFLPFPHREAASPINFLIYGSSTSLGLYAAQLVRLSSVTSCRPIRLIGVAGASNHRLLRQPPYNYDILIDYHDQDWPNKVWEATKNDGVQYALDCISEGDTVENVHSTLGPQAKLAVFRTPRGGGYDVSKLRIKPIYGAVWEGLGAEIGYNGSDHLSLVLGHPDASSLISLTIYLDEILPANADARDFATKFFSFLGSGAKADEIMLEPNPLRIMPGGLERVVPDGFTLLGKDGVSSRMTNDRLEEYMQPISAQKIVYPIQ
ncbi:chaperonin 10-like protein [Penicillium sp. DV-2018c]|nr:chaperonin 10-like protein [Penicillium sp. DV-2018c]KAJ5567657.1 chaperonin 10-like protein [Penicillium sp. DV-2018c]